MATKVHSKTFLPDQCTAGEVQVTVHGTSGWPIYHEDRALSMQFCNGLASMLIGSAGYEKEILKQTMLKHEATFRAQVYELHRLYRRQRELTEELRRKDLSHYSTNLQASQSSITTSKWNSLKSPCLPAASSSFSRPTTSATVHNSQKTIKCFGTEPEPSPAPSENSFWYGSEVLSSEPPRPNAGVIDLRLPADAYIDVGNPTGGDTKDFTLKVFQAPGLPDVNPNIKSQKEDTSLASRERDDDLQRQTLSSVLSNSQKPDSLSDFNKLINSSSKLSRCQQAPEQDSNLFNKEKETSCHVIRFEKGFPSFLEMDGGVKRRKLGFSNHDSGNTSSIDHVFYGETGYKFAEPMKTQESFLFALSSGSPSEVCFKDKSMLIGTGKNIPATSICTVLTMPAMPSIPNRGSVNITFPLVNSLTDLKDTADNVPVSDSQSTCFRSSRTSTNKSKIEDTSNCMPPSVSDRQKFSVSSSHSTCYHDSVPSEMKSSPGVYLTQSSSGKQSETVNLAHPSTATNRDQIPFTGLHSSASKPVKGIDLNLPGDLSETFSQQHVANKYSDAEEPASGLPWLKSDSPTSFVLGKGMSDSPERVQPKNKETSCVPGYRKIFGVPVLDSSFNAATYLHPSEMSSKVKNSSDLQNRPSEELVSDKSSATGGRMGINLNSVDSFTDGSPNCSKEFNSEAKDALGSHDSVVAGKPRPVIDLELPPELLQEESLVYKVDAPEVHLPAPVNIPTDAESKIKEDSTAKAAAETIVKMSSKICERPVPESINRLPSDEISADYLHWFADVVSSHTGSGVPSEYEANHRQGSGREGLDFLEAMTLQLVETKVDDFLPTVPDKENREDTAIVSPCLLIKARRGPARKRRQRRDFQKDVLPGLASLSRHEVSEDIQTIGGMMRAVGQLWLSGGARRNNGRNAGGCQAKGRRRHRGGGVGGAAAAAAVVVEVPVESPPRKVNFADFEMDGRSIMGWGRTRRCRRPRFPLGISVSPGLS